MKTFFKDIFAYHHHFNQLFIDHFIEHRQLIPDDTYGLFCHVLNAHQVWNSRLLGNTPFGIHQLHHLDDCKAIDYSNYQDSLFVLDRMDLERTISYTNSKGEQFNNLVRDILFHVNNHSTHHRAQIASTFRQLGIAPPISDFIFYKRQQP